MSLTLPTFDELVSELTTELGEDSSDTEVTDRIGVWLNDVFQDILCRRPDWKWARYVRELTLSAAYQTGTVTVTNGSTSVTGSGTSWGTSWENRVFWVSGGGANYRVASVDSTTGLTLDTAFQEDTESGASYVLAQERYPLDNQDYEAGIIQIINPYANDPLEEVGILDLIREDPKRRTLGDPTKYAVWGREEMDAGTDPGGVFLYFNRFTSVARKVHYFCHRQFDRFSGSDRFPLPGRFYTNVLKAGVKALAREFDDQIPESVSQNYEKFIQLMLQENAKSGNRTRQFKATDIPSTGVDGTNLPGAYPRMRY